MGIFGTTGKVVLYEQQLEHFRQVLAGCSGEAGLHTGLPDS